MEEEKNNYTDPTYIPPWAKKQCPHGVIDPKDCFICSQEEKQKEEDADKNNPKEGEGTGES